MNTLIFSKHYLKGSLFLFLVLFKIQLQAQTLPQIIPASPESSSIAKYLNYPVSYSTGIPDISIPLYEVKVGDIVLPISLSYHASGMKLNEQLGWVGAGWTLNAEPSLTRSIQGKVDENGYLLSTPVTPVYPYSHFSTPGAYLDAYVLSLSRGAFDEEPDQFYYKLNDLSGGFYFNRQPRSNNAYKITTLPYQPVKINYVSNQLFTITDPNGLLYRFGTSLSNTFYGEGTTMQNGSGGTTGWKGTEIISQSGRDTLSFDYHPSVSKTTVNLTDMITVEDSVSIPSYDYFFFGDNCRYEDFPSINDLGIIKGVSVDPSTAYGTMYMRSCSPTTQPIQNISYNTMTTRKLKEIKFSGGKVVFEKQNDQLTSIKVFTADNELVKGFLFFQSLISASLAPPLTRLDSIQLIDNTGQRVSSYKFGYNAHAQPNALISKNADYWGYYTGNYSASTLVPYTEVSAINNTSVTVGWTNHTTFPIGTGREPSAADAMAGMLTSITNPAGGSTAFLYEGNQYKDAGDNLRGGPGLRIAKITHLDPVTSSSITKIYKYGINEDGMGYIKAQITPEIYSAEQKKIFLRLDGTGGAYTNNMRKRTYYSDLTTDMFYSNGSPIVYPEVTEYEIESGPSPQTNGKTVYKYDYQDQSFSVHKVPGTTLYYDQRDQWSKGQLKSKEVYKRNGSTYDLLERSGYDYSYLTTEFIPYGKTYAKNEVINLEGYQFPDAYEDVYYFSNSYRSGTAFMIKDSTETWSGSVKNILTKQYSYDVSGDMNLRTRQVSSKGSDGIQLTTSYVYPQNTVLSGAEETGRQRLYNDWRINTVLEETNVKGTATQKTKTDYNDIGSLALPVKVSTNTGTAGAYEPRLNFHSYNPKGRLSSVSQEKGSKICYLYSYRNQYPIAEIKNADYTTVESALGGSATVNSFAASNPTDAQVITFIATVRAALPGAQITTYTYKPLIGMTSQTDSKGMTTYYEYDTFQRLRFIKDHNGHIIKSYDYHYKP